MKEKLVPIAGTPINMLNLPAGCSFCARCENAMKICLTEKPEELEINENHKASCWMNVKEALMAEGGNENE
jgi:oligopeptide transport system ATP-binding protein